MAAPLFDPKEPRADSLIRILRSRMLIAYREVAIYEEAVRPLFFAPPPKHQPVHIGSCVVVEISGQYFLFSASHVIEEFDNWALLIGCGTRLHSVVGERFSSARGPSGTHQDDPIDACVFHVQGVVPDDLKACALGIRAMDLDPPKKCFIPHAMMGYRVKNSRRRRNQCITKLEVYPSIEHLRSAYENLRIDPDTHVALAMEKLVMVGDQWQPAPGLRGMSGGAIFRIDGLSVDPLSDAGIDFAPMLSSILIEQRQEKGGRPGVVVGTRIGFHLGLIQKYLPDVIGMAVANECHPDP